MTTKRFHHAFLIVWACCSMSFAVGITYNTAGIFFPSVLKEIGMSRAALALYMSVIGFACAAFLPIAGKILKGKHMRLFLSLACLVHAATTASMSMFTHVYHWYIAGALLGMTMTVFLYVGTPTLIGRWFAHNVGFYVGLCFAFTVGGAIVFNPIAGWAIVTWGWRMGYLAMGILSLVLIFLPVALFVRPNPEDLGLKPHGIEKVKQGTTDVRLTGATLASTFKSPTIVFILIYLVAVALFSDIYVYIPTFGAGKGLPTMFLSTVMSAAMIGAVVGKVAFGALHEKTPMGTMVILGLIGVGGALGILYGVGSPAVLLTGAFFYGVAYSSCTVQSALIMQKIVGLKNFPQIYATVMMIYSLGSAAGQSVWGLIADMNGGDFTISFWCVAGLAVVFGGSAIMALALKKKVIWEQA
ncbi:MAG: MFS transporter [Smithellaceae bacterium]